jgi:hypothetical protein
VIGAKPRVPWLSLAGKSQATPLMRYEESGRWFETAGSAFLITDKNLTRQKTCQP